VHLLMFLKIGALLRHIILRTALPMQIWITTAIWIWSSIISMIRLHYMRNSMMDDKPADGHYLTVQLAGDSLNRNGMGAWVELYYAGKHQAYEQTPYRGYLSTVQLNPYFGLGAVLR
jgi:hypothetical protein